MNERYKRDAEEAACKYCYELYKTIRKVMGLVGDQEQYNLHVREALNKIDNLCYAFDSYVRSKHNEGKVS